MYNKLFMLFNYWMLHLRGGEFAPIKLF